MTGFDVSVDVAMCVLGIGCMYLASNESSFVCVHGKKQTCVPVYLNSYNTCDVIMYLLRHCVVCYKLLCAMLLRS